MVSRENWVIAVSIVAAVGLLYVLVEMTTVSTWLAYGAMFLVGVILPMILNELLDRRAS